MWEASNQAGNTAGTGEEAQGEEKQGVQWSPEAIAQQEEAFWAWEMDLLGDEGGNGRQERK